MAAGRAGAPVRGGCCHRCGAVRADADDASQGSSSGTRAVPAGYVVAGAVVCGALAFRRRWPLWVLWVTVAGALVHTVLERSGAAGTPFLVASSLAVFTFVLASGRECQGWPGARSRRWCCFAPTGCGSPARGGTRRMWACWPGPEWPSRPVLRCATAARTWPPCGNERGVRRRLASRRPGGGSSRSGCGSPASCMTWSLTTSR